MAEIKKALTNLLKRYQDTFLASPEEAKEQFISWLTGPEPDLTKTITDSWGNYASERGGLTLQEGCYELIYVDYSNVNYEPIQKLLEGLYRFEYNASACLNFLEFAKRKTPHLISELRLEDEWAYFVTNEPLSGPLWQDLAIAFNKQLDEDYLA